MAMMCDPGMVLWVTNAVTVARRGKPREGGDFLPHMSIAPMCPEGDQPTILY
jgi:hypothetical protein